MNSLCFVCKYKQPHSLLSHPKDLRKQGRQLQVAHLGFSSGLLLFFYEYFSGGAAVRHKGLVSDRPSRSCQKAARQKSGNKLEDVFTWRAGQRLRTNLLSSGAFSVIVIVTVPLGLFGYGQVE